MNLIINKIKIKMRIAIYTLLILVIGTGNVNAKGETEKVLFDKSFEVNENALLSVSHEMGNVKCKNWDKSEISVKIVATLETNDSEKASKAFNRVQFEVSGNRDKVDVFCKLKSAKNEGREVSPQVNVMIFMPESVRLDLEHKFGNAYIDKTAGQSKVHSSYGSVQLAALSHPESSFKLDFGEGEIGYFAGNTMIINYSSLELEEAGNVSLKSAYSDIEADRIGILDLKLEGGNLEIHQSDILKGSSKFSGIHIDRLSEILDVESSYGSLEVNYMPADFSEVIIKNSYGTVSVGIDENATYKLNAKATHCEIGYPKEMANFTERVKTTFKTTLIGTIGKGNEPQSKVSIDTEYGGVNLKSK
jgi:hypothetical protein